MWGDSGEREGAWGDSGEREGAWGDSGERERVWRQISKLGVGIQI